jgi:hypothetical protein
MYKYRPEEVDTDVSMIPVVSADKALSMFFFETLGEVVYYPVEIRVTSQILSI